MRINTLPLQKADKTANLVIPLFEKESPQKEDIFAHLSIYVRRLLKAFVQKNFKGKEGEVKHLWTSGLSPERIILLGLGKKDEWNERKARLAIRKIVREAKSAELKNIALPLGKMNQNPEKEAFDFTVNSLMADFDFDQYLQPSSRPKNLQGLSLLFSQQMEKNTRIRRHIRMGALIGEEVNLCRALANTPGGDMTPQKLAEAAREAARKADIKITIYDEEEIKRLGMGGILGVARGSEQRPRFIILEYQPQQTDMKRPIVFVGKGVTFDTGGLNLKPDQGIYEMHMDMSGGAAVIHGMSAIARLKLPVYAIGIIPAVENMVSGESYRPGDILRTFSGKTIEVLNTDAEGRIILADALSYAVKNYKPKLLIDFATLTGAAMVALGRHASALFVNKADPNLQNKLIEAGEKSGDYLWPLPLWDEYLSEIKGTFADVANIGKERWGGAIHGAKFLEQFVDKNTPWAHIDIAPRMTAAEGEFLAKGSAGTGVRLIAQIAMQNLS